VDAVLASDVSFSLCPPTHRCAGLVCFFSFPFVFWLHRVPGGDRQINQAQINGIESKRVANRLLTYRMIQIYLKTIQEKAHEI